MKNFSLSRLIILAVSLFIVGFVFYRFSAILGYILVSWVLSLIGQPIMRFYRRAKIGTLRMGPNISAVLTILTFVLIAGVVLWAFVPLVLRQAANLAEVDYGSIAGALEVPYEQFTNKMAEYGFSLQETKLEDLIRETLSGRFDPSKIGNVISNLVAATGNIFIGIFSIFFILFFFLKEQGLFVNFILALVPNEYEDQTREAIKDIVHLLSRYFSGILLQISIITLYMSVLLGILGIKNAILIGVFAAVINLIPYLGPIIGAAFGVFITISSNLDVEFYEVLLPMLIKVIVVFASMQLLDNFVLQPVIFSKSVLAHPLEIFIIILVGANLFGILGMVLAIPTYTIIRVIAREFLYQFKIVQKLTGKMDEADL